ncbi:IS1380 family transposase [Bordetella sp. 2513F-2]
MPKCTVEVVPMGRVGRRRIQASFTGGDLVSDGGVLLLRQVDRRLGLTRSASAALSDRRRVASVRHEVHTLLSQRVYGLCCGWEDISDHNVLRGDMALQTALGQVQELASAPTLSRFENAVDRGDTARLQAVLVEQFIAHWRGAPPAQLVLDIDATHVPLHGAQERAAFNRHYDNYCYLPVYVFCGQDLLACVLRPSDRDPAKILSALVRTLARRLRQAWPQVQLIVRADSGFCRAPALRRFERWGIDYVIGLQKNAALLQRTALAELALAENYERAQSKQRLIGEFSYAARTWSRQRRVIARLEHDARGANPRFVVTSLSGDAAELYERLYCARGEAENRIKEAQLDLFGRRASCHAWQANQLRLLLAALAYTLMVHLRRLALQGTQLAHACTQTIRTRLLKIGAAILRNTRRVRVLLASNHPMKAVFLLAAQRLGP